MNDPNLTINVNLQEFPSVDEKQIHKELKKSLPLFLFDATIYRNIVGYACELKCMSHIVQGLYLGSQESLRIAIKRSYPPFTHIVSIREQTKYIRPLPKRIQHLRIVLEDQDTTDLFQHFDTTTSWIDKSLRQPNSRVLVHCRRGVSRSASLVLAYLVRFGVEQNHAPKRPMTLTQAFDLVSCNRWINPNFGFLDQLERYERFHHNML